VTRRIVDAHTHIFPPDVVAHRRLYHSRDTWFRLLYDDPKLLLASPDDLIASMNVAGITLSIVCGFPWADPGLCREHNAWLAEACRTWPDRIAFLAIVVPNARDAARDAEHAFALGAVGIGELNADAQGFDLREPGGMSDLMQLCREHGKPLMLHATEPIGHPYPGKGSATPERLHAFLTAYPEQPVVLAHWGGGLPFYELMPEVRAVTRNTTYDSAATSYLYNSAVFQTVVALAGADRVLFASDYPILRQDRLVRRVERALPDVDVLERVYVANAERVYRLTHREELTR
jgi:predicted TIM-barrel fold metal-dependent hydrolase